MPPWGREPKPSEITPYSLYLQRREFLALGAAATLVACTKKASDGGPPPGDAGGAPLTSKPSAYTVDEPRTTYEAITHYNNFYEFGTDKADPASHAGTLKPRPWTVKIEGEVTKPQTVD